MIVFLARGSSLVRCVLWMCAYAVVPKGYVLIIDGGRLYISSYGVLFPVAFDVIRLLMYIAVRAASPQRYAGAFASNSIALRRPRIVLLSLSEMPVCWGVCGVVNCCSVPRSCRYFSNSLFLYSPPLSLRIVSGHRPVIFFMRFAYVFQQSSASLLCLIRKPLV